MRSWCLLPTLVLACVVGCVPADEALPLGSAEFTVTGRASPRVLVGGEQVVDGWSIRIDRFVLSFKTMTIVNLLNSDQCAYRGRGAASNVVFEATEGSVVQAFNGIKPGACPDVGMRLGAPDDRTVLGEGATVADLVALATGRPALALVEATATFGVTSPGNTSSGGTPPAKPMHVSLRFDASTTAAAFGGCRDATKGAKIRPEARYALFVSFALENLFRDAISATASLRFSPFVEADQLGNSDGIVTMDEVDALPLTSVGFRGGSLYQLPDATLRGSFGDYLRKQFQFSLKFGNGGQCNGIDPGTEGL